MCSTFPNAAKLTLELSPNYGRPRGGLTSDDYAAFRRMQHPRHFTLWGSLGDRKFWLRLWNCRPSALQSFVIQILPETGSAPFDHSGFALPILGFLTAVDVGAMDSDSMQHMANAFDGGVFPASVRFLRFEFGCNKSGDESDAGLRASLGRAGFHLATRTYHNGGKWVTEVWSSVLDGTATGLETPTCTLNF